jgi:hypothetical protein
VSLFVLGPYSRLLFFNQCVIDVQFSFLSYIFTPQYPV